MKTYKRLRLISYGICLVLNIIGLFVYARSFNIAKDLAMLPLMLGVAFLFLVTHYLCFVGQATRNDFGLLIGLYIISMFLGALYWIDGTTIIEWVSLGVITILLVEYQWPDWFKGIREYLIKRRG